jgi:ankyrin repeat protein
MPENREIERRNSDEIERRQDSLVQRSLDYLKEFEEQGLANVEEPDLDGWDLHRAAEENRVDIARALIDRSVEVDAHDEEWDTPLQVAFWNEHFDMMRLLLEHGADVEVPGQYLQTLLHEVTRDIYSFNERIKVANLLIEQGAEIDARTEFGATPLWWAANDNQVEVAELLIKYGADLEAKDEPASGGEGQTPLLIAVENKSWGVARLLIDHGAVTNGIDLSWMDD